MSPVKQLSPYPPGTAAGVEYPRAAGQERVDQPGRAGIHRRPQPRWPQIPGVRAAGRGHAGNAPADALARLDQQHLMAALLQQVRGIKAAEAGA